VSHRSNADSRGSISSKGEWIRRESVRIERILFEVRHSCDMVIVPKIWAISDFVDEFYEVAVTEGLIEDRDDETWLALACDFAESDHWQRILANYSDPAHDSDWDMAWDWYRLWEQDARAAVI
jgi:hypothetical protein